LEFHCNVCGCTGISKEIARGDGQGVLFCADCGMGVVGNPPKTTDGFYDDGYYGTVAADVPGYSDYAFTAEHGLLWCRLIIEALAPPGGRILDVGCADGFLLHRLSGPFERFGIEVNAGASEQAAARGITMIANDVYDPNVTGGAWGKFDAIASIATFEHVLDFREAVRTCLDLLAPAGLLLFEVPLISDHRDNSDWFQSSYEHIYYPTVSGLDCLFRAFRDVYFTGFETDIKGYGSTYIGVATRDASMFARAQRLFQATAQPGLDGLDVVETQLNLAYHVVHCFRPTPERVLALPILLDIAATPNLLKRLTQLWYAESVRAVERDVHFNASGFYEQDARNWQEAYHALAAAKSG
jgi:SAM-dependent methyltransferase